MEQEARITGYRKRRRKETQGLLEEYRGSGKTQKDWCEEAGIGLSSLRYWLRREQDQAEKYSLVPIEMERSPEGSGVLELEIGGMSLRVGRGSDLGVLAGLLKEL